MFKHRTQILSVVTLLASGLTLWAYGQFDHAKREALATEHDLALVHHDLTDIARRTGASASIAVGRLDAAELSRRLNSAAVNAGVKDNLVDIDPGTSVPLANSDYKELLVILRFEKISLRQLTLFFEQLAANDPGSRAKMIELSSPDATASLSPRHPVPANADGSELWTADISIAYLLYAPREAKTR